MRHANGTINHTYCKCFRLSLTDEMCNFSVLLKLGDLHIVLGRSYSKQRASDSRLHTPFVNKVVPFKWIRDPQIGLRIRDWVRVRLLNSCFQASHYHKIYPYHPMSYSLYPLKPTWRTRVLTTSLVWNSKIVLVLNLVLLVQSEGPHLYNTTTYTLLSINYARTLEVKVKNDHRSKFSD